MIRVEEVLGEDGPIARSLQGYETRPQQLAMARAVQDTISSNNHLICEAPPGIGKSLAYLVPFIYWATSEKKRVVISTYTKTLQQQLIHRDLPFLKDALGVDFRFAISLGGENYLCLRRLARGELYDLFDERQDEISAILKWQSTTSTGLRSDLDFEPGPDVWAKVCREKDLCMGKECPHRDRCYYNKARQLQFGAHILVCNHHLYFANLVAEGKILPRFDGVVFDEAHNLEEVATGYLGIKVSNFRISSLCDDLKNPKTLSRIRAGRDLEDAVDEVRTASSIFFKEIASLFDEETASIRIRKQDTLFNHLKEPLSRLSHILKGLEGEGDEEEMEIRAFERRCTRINEDLSSIIEQSLGEYVYWIEVARSKYTLYASPIDVSKELKRMIFDRVRPIVLTSATLSTSGSFEYIKGRLGLDGCKELLLDSPFDHTTHTLLYTTAALPDPSTKVDQYEDRLIEEISEILSITNGRTLVLFTSFKVLNKAYEKLKTHRVRILRQGDLPRYKLIKEFVEGEDRVLFGVNTFWQGIDLPGETLQCVVITKLPFFPPDDPIHEARMELLESRNIDPFLSYHIPHAITMLKQGFGRLIRRKDDRGVVVILDPRVNTRFYGRWFLNALPPCRHTSTLDDVRGFFEEIERR